MATANLIKASAQSVPPSRVTDAVHTLVSVNNIDQSVFKTSDRAIASKYWDSVFLQNSVGDDLYDAIASISGSSVATRETVRTKQYYIIIC